MKQLFTEHPATVGETYLQHLHSALTFAMHMALGCLACTVHAFLPFLFEKTGSGKIAMLYDRMITNRSRLASDQPPAPRSRHADDLKVAELFTRQPDVET